MRNTQINSLSLTKVMQFLSISRIGGIILVGIVLAKMGLDMETIGKFELLFFLGKSATAFWANALAQALLPLYPKLKETQKGFFSTVAIIYGSLALITWLVLMLFKEPILTYFLRIDHLEYYNAYVLFLTLNVPSLFLEQYYTLRENPKRLIQYTFLSYTLYPIYFLIPIYLHLDLTLIFNILSIVALIKLSWIALLLAKEHWQLNPVILRKLLHVASHLVGYVLVGMMAEIIDGLIINHHYSSPEIFAIFRYGARELPLTTALLGGLSLASISKLSGDMQAHLPAFRKSINRVLKITFPVAIILMLTSQWLFVQFFSLKFQESAQIFNTYLLILGTRVLMPGSLVMAKLESKYMLWVSILELALNVVLSLVLLQYWGIVGIALGTVISSYVEKIAYYYILKKKYDISWTQTIDTQWYWAFWVSLHVVYGLVWMF